MLTHLAAGNTAELLRHLLGIESRPVSLPQPARRVQPSPSGQPDEGRWAFLIHPLTTQDYLDWDRSLGVLDEAEIHALLERFGDLMEPFVAGSTRIAAANGSMAYGEFIAVPKTADELMAMPHAEAVALVQQAVNLARGRGAKLVGLGAYNSVVTRGALHLRNPGVAITTGNSYTVVAAVDSVYKAVTELGTKLNEATIAVVGATGAIGRSVTILLAEDVEPAPADRQPGPAGTEPEAAAQGGGRHGPVPGAAER